MGKCLNKMRRPIDAEALARREGQYIEMPKVENVDFRTCAMCSHVKNCDILKENARFISANYDVEKHTNQSPNERKEDPKIPFEYMDLAKICRFFEYKSGSKTEELLRK